MCCVVISDCFADTLKGLSCDASHRFYLAQKYMIPKKINTDLKQGISALGRSTP